MLLLCLLQFLRILVTLFLKHALFASLLSLRQSGTAGEEWSGFCTGECVGGFLGCMED